MRHQVSESPIVLQIFLFLHILTNFYLCLSIVLKRVRLGDLCLRALGRTAFARACLVLLRAFGKKMGFGMLWPLTTANLKIYPAGERNFIPSLQHTTSIHHLFGLLCDQSVTRGAFGKMLVLFGYRFGYRSAWAPSLQVTCVRD